MSGELVEVFISYAHADDDLRKQFINHLSNMEGRIISTWHDREIPGGEEWNAVIDARLDSADLILLLISADFMASRYCREIEIPRALERHEAEEARVIPIILRPTAWKSSPLGKLQAYPTDGKPVQSRDWHNEDEAFVNVVEGIEAVATELLEKRWEKFQIRERNRGRYWQLLQAALADGVISPVERARLNGLKKDLGISDDDAAAMEAEASRPLEEKKKNLLRYEEALRHTIAAEGYPLSEEREEELKAYREELGLTPEDIAAMDQAIRTEAGTCTNTNSIGMEFILIRAGEFMMGSPDSDSNAYDTEKPQHPVKISQSFYLGKYPVTQAQWQAVMGDNPSRLKGEDRPVEYVSWEDAQAFIQKLNEREGGSSYRLPTEAQWEYACRAGSTGAYCFGDDASQLGEDAWYDDNADGTTHPVGQKKPNAWGLHDMHGNVWEWCHDDRRDYEPGLAVDPVGPTDAGAGRVFRGGSWNDPARDARSARRYRSLPGDRGDCLGFRCLSSGREPASGA